MSSGQSPTTIQSDPPDAEEKHGVMHSVVDLWGRALLKTVRMAVKVPIMIVYFPPKLAVFLLAMLVIVIFVGILFVIIYLLRHTHLRLPLPSHSASMDGFTTKLYADILASMTDYSKHCKYLTEQMTVNDYCVATNDSMDATTSCNMASAQDGLNELREKAKSLLEPIDTLLERWQTNSSEDELMTYYSFYKEIAKMNCFARHDIRHNAPDLCTDGDIDSDVISEFVKGVMRPMGRMEKMLSDLSDTLDQLPGLPNVKGWGRTQYQLTSAVHKLRLMVGYKEAVHFMLKTRRKKMKYAIWSQYYWPYVADIYEHRIPEVWLKTGPKYVQYIKSGVNWWWGIGVKIGLMPCNMAFPDPVERLEKCRARDVTGKEMFTEQQQQQQQQQQQAIDGDSGGIFSWLDGKDVKKRRWLEKRDKARRDKRDKAAAAAGGQQEEGYQSSPDVVETVSITGALGAITNFILNIKFVGIAIARFGKQFPKDPFGSIIGILSLILGVILGLIFMLLYLFLTFTGAFWLLLCVWGIIITFVTAILYTIYQFIMSILMAIPYFVLWLIDMTTGGLVSRMLRCENLPDDWVDLPNYADSNTWQRTAFMCFKPCGARFTPVGCMCKRRKFYLPDYCPQQQIYRAFVGKGIKGGLARFDAPYVFEKYSPMAGFGRIGLQKKQKMIISAYRDKMAWYQKCYASLEDYDYVNRHVCRNVDLVEGLMDSERRKLTTLCRESYCDYRPTHGKIGGIKSGIKATMTGEEEARAGVMCGALYGKKRPGTDKADDNNSSLSGPGTSLMRRVLLMLMLVLASLAMFYSMLQAAKQMTASIK